MRKTKTKLLALSLAVIMAFSMVASGCQSGSKDASQKSSQSDGKSEVLSKEDPAFQNGPYLIAPKTDSMVIAWEALKDTKSTVSFGTEQGKYTESVDVEVDKDAPDFNGAKMNLFHCKIDKLKPNTKYYYQVKLESGAVCDAFFTTLPKDSQDMKIFTLSDSHLFATRSEVNKAISSYNPNVILHCGDLVEGTGANADQFSYWLKGREDNDFIHFYPVIYASGNHDQGGEYFNTYLYSLQDKEYGAQVEGDSSVDFGGIHVITMNSNPWGLFQLNMESGGSEVGGETLDTINNALDWLKKDLESDNAKNAAFRIIIMHHPVTDKYTKMYIPAIIEPGNVDLMLAGHTHSYDRQVSDDPTVGAGTVYLTHQDARSYSAKGDFFYIDYNAKDGILDVKDYGSDEENTDPEMSNETIIAKDKQQLTLSDIKIEPNEVLYNGDVTITATVKNDGLGLAAAVIPVEDNKETSYLYKFDGSKVTLNAGDEETLTGTVPMTSLGDHTVKVGDKEVKVKVNYRPATFKYSDILTKLGDEEVSNVDSNILHVKAKVTNIGNDTGTFPAELKIDGKTVDQKDMTLDSDKSDTVEFTYSFEKAGDYQVTVGDAEPVTVTIEGSIQGMPIIKDKSGNGNDAYVHGSPELGTDENGKQTLILDGKTDYLEIPDDKSIIPGSDAGETGMVWANLPSEGTKGPGVNELTENEMDHNPLMVKGVSIGWGTPYMFRLAVRGSGLLTSGVCLGDDNGEYQWTDETQYGITKDKFVQYTSSFDQENGGDIYEGDVHSAHVDKPAFEAELKTWEGAPMRIGLAFAKTILPKMGRGMKHTMLPGAVSQVRFYTTRLTEDEVKEAREKSDAAGSKEKDLKVWLDFENENIESKGSHTTEWVETSGSPKSLSYDVALEGDAKATATIRTSDDGSTVKEEKSFDLTDGQNTLDISSLGNAKYISIKTDFVSDLNGKSSNIPVLYEYRLNCGNETVWNTIVDWNKGTFEGAAGHQASHVYRDYEKDFDDFDK